MDINDITKIGFGFGMAGFMLAALVLGLGAFQDDMTANSWEYNITEDVLEGIGNVTGQFPVAGTIAGVALIIGIVGIGFWFVGSRVYNR